MTKNPYGQRQMSFHEFKSQIKTFASRPWETCSSYEQAKMITEFADQLRGDEAISRRTQISAETWARDIF